MKRALCSIALYVLFVGGTEAPPKKYKQQPQNDFFFPGMSAPKYRVGDRKLIYPTQKPRTDLDPVVMA